jgi:hypothetical protein
MNLDDISNVVTDARNQLFSNFDWKAIAAVIAAGIAGYCMRLMRK